MKESLPTLIPDQDH